MCCSFLSSGVTMKLPKAACSDRGAVGGED